jgi:hypothetical protein
MRAPSLGGTLRGDPGRTEPHDQAHAGAVGTRHRQRQLEAPFLHEAGVRTTSVRFNGTLHDFLMLNPICGKLPSNRRSTFSARRPEPANRHRQSRQAFT